MGNSKDWFGTIIEVAWDVLLLGAGISVVSSTIGHPLGINAYYMGVGVIGILFTSAKVVKARFQ